MSKESLKKLEDIKRNFGKYDIAEIQKTLLKFYVRYDINDFTYHTISHKQLIFQIFFDNYKELHENFRKEFLGAITSRDIEAFYYGDWLDDFLSSMDLEKINTYVKERCHDYYWYRNDYIVKKIINYHFSGIKKDLKVVLIRKLVTIFTNYNSRHISVDFTANLIFANHKLFDEQEIVTIWNGLINEENAAPISKKLGVHFKMMSQLTVTELLLLKLLNFNSALKNISKIVRNNFNDISEILRNRVIDRCIELEIVESSLLGILKDYSSFLNLSQKRGIRNNLEKEKAFRKSMESLNLMT